METILFENNDSVKKTYEIENLHWGWELIYNQTLIEKHNFNKIEKNEKYFTILQIIFKRCQILD